MNRAAARSADPLFNRLSGRFSHARQWQAACHTTLEMQADAGGARVLDPAVIDELRETFGEAGGDGAGGPDVVDVAASRFIARSAARLEAAHEAAARGDAAMLARLAHSLIGGASQLGAERMTTLAAQLEDLARNGTLDGAAVVVTRLNDAFIETKAALQAMGVSIESLDGSGGADD